MKYAFLFLSLCLHTVYAQQPAPSNNKAERLQIAAAMENSLQKELLAQWYPRSFDTVYGGFTSSYTYDFKPAPNQDKMIVTQARHTWVNAKAAERYPAMAYYTAGAKHGFLFLKDVMWDKTYGGFYTLVDQEGRVKRTGFAEKEAYGNAFGIYALAAYYKTSGDTAALGLAKRAFAWLEAHSHDQVYKGYFQHMQRDGTPVKRTADIPSVSDLGYKDQNSSIHLLEAFTELYLAWPDPLLRERLTEMLLLIRDTIVSPKGNLILFFQPDWTPVSFGNSDKENILKHRYLDHVSFGHDVETAWLMLEASHVLGFKDDSITLHKAKQMVDHALHNGWDSVVGGFYDEGYYFKGDDGITIIKDTKNWWAQAEGMNTLLFMADLFPNDPLRYFEKFKQLWNYAQTYLIDHEHGDWYEGGLDKQPELKKSLKGHIWKATYHHFRSLSNCISALRNSKS
ncbi:AGE family epimerase/isomerase [Agriterribacter sp.]|uniref:AGE family epimerase/isomerase n=1 Tax=Agriterribacter sp. TaxID=2821509 RepID=UPI002B7E693F|nr:AGE family epimerase/isomerase [Agriterribacter sp.]HRP57253.1 AGE family epimerase/isomerase [Agriterribacter sp.]